MSPVTLAGEKERRRNPMARGPKPQQWHSTVLTVSALFTALQSQSKRGEAVSLDVFDGELLGGPGVRIWCFHCFRPGSIPGLGTEIPHKATACRSQKEKTKRKRRGRQGDQGSVSPEGRLEAGEVQS